jgi:hypothetical protein
MAARLAMKRAFNAVHIIAIAIFAGGGLLMSASLRAPEGTGAVTGFTLMIVGAIAILLANISAAIVAIPKGGDFYWRSSAPIGFSLLATVFGGMKALNEDLILLAVLSGMMGVTAGFIALKPAKKYGGLTAIFMLAAGLATAEGPAYGLTMVTAAFLPLLAATSVTLWALVKRGS